MEDGGRKKVMQRLITFVELMLVSRSLRRLYFVHPRGVLILVLCPTYSVPSAVQTTTRVSVVCVYVCKFSVCPFVGGHGLPSFAYHNY